MKHDSDTRKRKPCNCVHCRSEKESIVQLLLSGHPSVVEFEAWMAKVARAMSGGAKYEARQ